MYRLIVLARTFFNCSANHKQLQKTLSALIFSLLPASAYASDLASELPAKYTNQIGMSFVLIPPGMYQMRSYRAYNEDQNSEPGWHWVRFNKPFYLQTTEVTQQQWEQVMIASAKKGTSEELFSTQAGLVFRYEVTMNNDYESTYRSYEPLNTGPNYPVHYIDPEYADVFLKYLRKDGLSYRLPTEAEWEYAALAGQPKPFPDSELRFHTNCWVDAEKLIAIALEKNASYVWPTHDSDRFDNLAPVGSYPPNAWGLYDMVGNVNELVTDYKPANHKQKREDYLIDDPIPNPPKYPVYLSVKGGSFSAKPKDCNPFLLQSYSLDDTFETGFRVLLEAESVRQKLKADRARQSDRNTSQP